MPDLLVAEALEDEVELGEEADAALAKRAAVEDRFEASRSLPTLAAVERDPVVTA